MQGWKNTVLSHGHTGSKGELESHVKIPNMHFMLRRHGTLYIYIDIDQYSMGHFTSKLM